MKASDDLLDWLRYAAGNWAHLAGPLNAVADEIERLRARVAELERDQRWLDWLESKKDPSWAYWLIEVDTDGICIQESSGGSEGFESDELRLAIDAAMDSEASDGE